MSEQKESAKEYVRAGEKELEKKHFSFSAYQHALLIEF